MGFMTETALLKTTEKGFKNEAELLTALLAEQRQTNALLAQLLMALAGPQLAQKTPTWGQR